MSPDKAIIISTHLLEEVEAVCSRAIIIARGRILADGTPTELAARSRYHNAVRVGLPAAGTDPTIAAELAGLPGVASIERASDGEGDGLWLFPRGQRPIIAEVARIGSRPRLDGDRDSRAERGRLDDVFRAITTPQPVATRSGARGGVIGAEHNRGASATAGLRIPRREVRSSDELQDRTSSREPASACCHRRAGRMGPGLSPG